MTINKYQGKTKEEAVEKAKQELGAGAAGDGFAASGETADGLCCDLSG